MSKVPEEVAVVSDSEVHAKETSKNDQHSVTGCGRRGASKFHNSNVITGERRIHIAIVAAALIQARTKVAKSKRSSGRPRKSHSDDPWAGGLSPSAKAFTMLQLPKLSSPRSVQNRNSIKRDNFADRRVRNETDKDESQGKVVKREENSELEVKIVPKFPIEGSASRTFRSPSHAESDDDLESLDLNNEPRRRRGRPRKSFPVIKRDRDGSNVEVVISPKAIPAKKVTIMDNSTATSPVKGEDHYRSSPVNKGRIRFPKEPKDAQVRDRKSIPASFSVRNSTKGTPELARKELPKRGGVKGEAKEKSVSPVGKGTGRFRKKNDGSQPSRKLLKSKVFKEAPAYDTPLIRDVEMGHRAVTVHKVIPAHLLKPVSLIGYKMSTRNIKITPSKVVLTKLEVSPEEALNRLLVIEALLKAQKGGKKAAAVARAVGKVSKGRGKVKQEQQIEKTVRINTL